MYGMELGYKPKWIIIIGIPVGIILGVGITYMGYLIGEDFLIYFGILMMIFVVAFCTILYYLIKRNMKDIKSDMGLDLEGLLDMDRGLKTAGMAEVVSVESTGEYVNNNPEFILLLKVTPQGQGTFQETFQVEIKQAFKDETSISVGAKAPVIFDKNKNVQLIGNLGEYKASDLKELFKK